MVSRENIGIFGAQVFLDGSFVQASLVIEDERIVFAGSRAQLEDQVFSQVIDARDCYVVPGFIDLHFHGCGGYDFCDGTQDALDAIARYEASRGVTAICPATMTLPEDALLPVMDAAAAFSPAADQAMLVGINMEGPFISLRKVGAQNPAYVQPCDVEMFRRLQERSGGLIKLVDIAPEEEGALDFIHELASEVRISLAHTCADYETAYQAFAAGARQLTHTCNAMPPLLHRDPGPIGAALGFDAVMAELICDGVHVHPAMAQTLFAAFGSDRIILVSDSIEATGCSDGDYELGGQSVQVKGGLATLADGTLAGSVCDLAACVQHAVCDMGISLEAAIAAATINPARALGIEAERGVLAPGAIADCVVLDANLNVVQVVVRGKIIEPFQD